MCLVELDLDDLQVLSAKLLGTVDVCVWLKLDLDNLPASFAKSLSIQHLFSGPSSEQML